MKSFFKIAALFALFFVGPAAAQTFVPVQIVPLGYCQLSSIATAVKLSTCPGGIPAGANAAYMHAEGTQGVRWTDDGSVPTAAIGNPLATTDAPIWYTGTLSAVQVIQEAASAKLNVSFYKIP